MLAQVHHILLETIESSKTHDSDISSHLPLIFTSCYDQLIKYNGNVIVELINGEGLSAPIFDKIGQLMPINLISINHAKIIPKTLQVADLIQRSNFYQMTSAEYASHHITQMIQAGMKSEIDILFIDSLHTYDHTLQELQLYVPLMAPNGLIILHDSYMSPIQPGFGWKLSNGRVMYGGWDNHRGVSRAIETYFNMEIDESKTFSRVFSSNNEVGLYWSIEHYPICNGLTLLRKVNHQDQNLTRMGRKPKLDKGQHLPTLLPEFQRLGSVHTQPPETTQAPEPVQTLAPEPDIRIDITASEITTDPEAVFNVVPLSPSSNVPISSNKMAVIFFHKNIEAIYKPEWIHKCVKSILNQTAQDFDIFEVNYGNQSQSLFGENSITNLSANSKSNDRLHFFYRRDYQNHAYAMNFILSECFSKGYDMVFNTNLDDNYHLSRFEKQKQAIRQGYDLVSSLWYYIEDQNGTDRITQIFDPQKLNFTDPYQLYLDSSTIKTQLNKNQNVINHSAICMSSNFWNSRDKFGNRLRYRNDIHYEDMTLWTRAINNQVKITIINDYLVNYRIHSNSIGAQPLTPQQKPSKVERRIGIILVATGKYKSYLENIISRIEQYFFVGLPKTYFITTDDDQIIIELENKLNIHGRFSGRSLQIVSRITHHKGFPLDTLYRYHYLLEMKDDILLKSDLVYYFDVDMDVTQKISTDVIPKGRHVLVGVKHPGSCLPHNVGGFATPNGTPETRPISTAYIAQNQLVNHYIAGGFNGGLSADFLKMAEVIKANINLDKDNDVIAVWHDESHLNKYLSDHFAKFHILEPSYCYPEDWHYPEFQYERKILALAKNHTAVRNDNQNQVCSELGGGLGNKLFIAAAVLAYAFDHNLQPVFIYTMDPQDKRPSANKYYCFDNLLKIKEPTFSYITHRETQFSFQPIEFDDSNSDYPKNIRFAGYFQSYKYFYHQREKIYSLMNFSHYEVMCQNLYQQIQKQVGSDTVSIQVRRTDYVTLSHYFHNLSMNYYQKAMKLFPRSCSFVIFSDDIEWCKHQPIFSKLDSHLCYFVNNSNEELSLLLMSKCKDHIIANSSYGMWASYLGSSTAKTVMPSKWFASEGPMCNLSDFTPPDRQYIQVDD
jgi:hypothetical protein